MRFVPPTLLLAALALPLFRPPSAAAGNWPGWRGPTGVGNTAEDNLPLTWNHKTKENIAWKADLKDRTGHSSPVVWGDRVFITTATKQTNAQEKAEIPDHFVGCYSVSDGTLLWETKVDHGPQSAGYAIYAVPTPVTDGRAVYCWFGSAVIAAVDFDGKVLWRHERPKMPDNAFNPGICSSPVLYGDTVLLLQNMGRGGGWLQALDKTTGDVKWEQKRPRSDQCNTTPVLMYVRHEPQLLVQESKELAGLDPTTGETIWFCKNKGFGSSPVHDGSGLVFSDTGNGESAAVVDPTGKGDVTASNLKWKAPRVPSQYGSAVIAGGYVYRASDKGVITCWTLATGEQVFSEPAEGVSKLCSPVATADGRVYFASAKKSYVLKAGPKFDVLAVNELDGGDNAASAAVADGRIFIRGDRMLYCIGRRPGS